MVYGWLMGTVSYAVPIGFFYTTVVPLGPYEMS